MWDVPCEQIYGKGSFNIAWVRSLSFLRNFVVRNFDFLAWPLLQAQLYHCSYQALDQTNRSHLQLFKTRQFGLSSVAAASPTRFLVGYRCSCRSNKSLSRFVIKATETDSSSSNQEEEEKYEEYEVEIERPFGLKFAKGRDGAVYIDAIAPGLSADKTGKFTVGDKVIATSAMFGTEIWPAAEYGRTMYTIRQRIGPLYMKMLKRYGNLDYASGKMTEKEIIRAERNAGFISNRIREIQVITLLSTSKSLIVIVLLPDCLILVDYVDLLCIVDNMVRKLLEKMLIVFVKNRLHSCWWYTVVIGRSC